MAAKHINAHEVFPLTGDYRNKDKGRTERISELD